MTDRESAIVLHTLRHRAPDLDEDQLAAVEERLRGLGKIPSVRFLSVSRDRDDMHAIILMIMFDSANALESYRTHPVHLDTVAYLRGLPLETTRINVEVTSSKLASAIGRLP